MKYGGMESQISEVSQIAIQVGVLTGNKAARQAYGMIINSLSPPVPDYTML